ncbi:hypothetical protein EVAR_69237_1 [Eumeta japonica]|uniref:Uncharacterized protein n=1 Tax=Eumeta variegata TaxID=151549 RepID=A0A4C2A8F6_EUMVA|nr:hypothetical protein EVAR_69237_1 [Eumeta japonica]
MSKEAHGDRRELSPTLAYCGLGAIKDRRHQRGDNVRDRRFSVLYEAQDARDLFCHLSLKLAVRPWSGLNLIASDLKSMILTTERPLLHID